MSKRGETLAEVLASVVVTALALLMLSAAFSVLAPLKTHTDTEPYRGTVNMTFKLGYSSVESDLDVIYNEEGYTYAPN